jgi:hypothetical protein
MAEQRPGTVIHGMYGTPTYRSWAEMKTRVKNSRRARFHDYGGRGIDMDPRWENFEIFLSDMGIKPNGESLERRDNSRGYWPDNCCWANRVDQANNKRNNRLISIGGEVKTLTQWARSAGLVSATLRNRLEAGWEESRLLVGPGPNNGKRKEARV